MTKTRDKAVEAINAVLEEEREEHLRVIAKLQEDIRALTALLEDKSPDSAKLAREWQVGKESAYLSEGLLLRQELHPGGNVTTVCLEEDRVHIRQFRPYQSDSGEAGLWQVIPDGYGCTIAAETLVGAAKAIVTRKLRGEPPMDEALPEAAPQAWVRSNGIVCVPEHLLERLGVVPGVRGVGVTWLAAKKGLLLISDEDLFGDFARDEDER